MASGLHTACCATLTSCPSFAFLKILGTSASALLHAHLRCLCLACAWLICCTDMRVPVHHVAASLSYRGFNYFAALVVGRNGLQILHSKQAMVAMSSLPPTALGDRRCIQYPVLAAKALRHSGWRPSRLLECRFHVPRCCKDTDLFNVSARLMSEEAAPIQESSAVDRFCRRHPGRKASGCLSWATVLCTLPKATTSFWSSWEVMQTGH